MGTKRINVSRWSLQELDLARFKARKEVVHLVGSLFAIHCFESRQTLVPLRPVNRSLCNEVSKWSGLRPRLRRVVPGKHLNGCLVTSPEWPGRTSLHTVDWRNIKPRVPGSVVRMPLAFAGFLAVSLSSRCEQDTRRCCTFRMRKA